MQQLINFRTFLERVGCKRTKGYDLINEGEINPVKIGRRTFFIEAEIDQFIEKLPRYRLSNRIETTPLSSREDGAGQ